MQPLNRRQWLKTAGLTGAFSMLGGIGALAENKSDSYILQTARRLETPVRLSSNENPYGPSKKVREAMIEAFDLACRYPFYYSNELREMIAQKEGVAPEQIVLTAGSTEGLKVTGLTYGRDGGEVICADPTYQSLMSYAEQFGGYIHRVRVNKDLDHDLEEMERRITNKTSIVFICNPNNPTGTLLPHDQLHDFCLAANERAIVFADEAYGEYIEDPHYPSAVHLIKEGLNVIVSRTFSKVYGMAGIRAGYLIARPDIARRLAANVVAHINVLGLFAAKTALEDAEFYQQSLQKNKESKEIIYGALDKLGLEYKKSHTNFVFFKTGRPIAEIQEKMLAKGVIVGRPFPPLLDWCRISTGTIEETELFAEALGKVV